MTLRYATLRYATLRYATLRYATLRYATLRYGYGYATLRYATLRLRLRYATLRLRYATLRLRYATLRYEAIVQNRKSHLLNQKFKMIIFGITSVGLTGQCNRLKCPLARFSGLQCYNMGHNGHEINLYGHYG